MLNKKLTHIHEDLVNPEHYLPDLLKNDAPKKTFYFEWAKILELKYIIEDTPNLIAEISNTIRIKLISLNHQNKLSWMYDSLPGKYKQHKYNPAWGEPTNNSSPNINYELENKLTIDRITEHITVFEAIREKLKTTEFLSKRNKKGRLLLNPNRVKSDYTILQAADKFAKDVFDDRKDVSIHTQHYLITMVMRYNLGHATGAYLGFIKDFRAKARKKSIDILDDLLSTKQVRKIMRGLTKELHARYDPKNKQEAQLTGFYGDQCSNCESWRVDFDYVYSEETDTTEKLCTCHGCNESWVPKLEVLPNVRPSIIIDSQGIT